MFGGAEQTMVFYATMTRKHSIIDMHLAHIGPLTSLPLQPREMYRQAFYDGAAEIALMHNHPLCGALHNKCYAEMIIMLSYLSLTTATGCVNVI